MQKTMLDVLQERLIPGLSISSVKETNSKYTIEFHYMGDKVKAELPKTCAPGCHNEVADNTVNTAMSTVFFNRGDYVKSKEWLYKIGKKKD